MKAWTVFAVLVVCFFAAALAASKRVKMEPTQSSMTYGWTATARPLDSTALRIIIAPKLRNLDALDAIFWAVSDPVHPDYGKHLTREELSELVSPAEEDLRVIQQWLASHNIMIEDMHMGGDFLFAHATVAQLRDALEADFVVFKHEENGAELVRSQNGYTLPREVASRVDFIAGVSGLPQLHRRRTTQNARAVGADAPIGPADLRARYNVTVVGDASLVNNTQAVAEFQAQYYSPEDLKTFFTKFVSYSTSDTVAKVVGTNGNSPGTEAELDIQYIMGVAPNIPTWFYSYPDFDFWTDLVQYFSALGNDSTSPHVHSISYGDQREDQPSEDYKQRMNIEFQKVGTMGHSIIIASGDSGTGCDFCYKFQASFPSTSPYVTAVGATRFQSGTSGPEAAVDNFPSGGGFSRSFAAPSYQTAAIAKYFQVAGSDLPSPGRYNASGRGTPDVSALGTGFQVIQGGAVETVAGTSASTPTFAAIVSLLNQVRLKANKPVMGFLNPWIYQTAAKNANAFYDVTVGSNPDGCCFKGFPCEAGWDPVTGVGTPNYAVLAALV